MYAVENEGVYAYTYTKTTNDEQKRGDGDNYVQIKVLARGCLEKKKERNLSFFGTPEGKKRVHLPTPHNVLPQLKKKGEKRKKITSIYRFTSSTQVHQQQSTLSNTSQRNSNISRLPDSYRLVRHQHQHQQHQLKSTQTQLQHWQQRR